jgi:hypothetical protein
MNDEVKKEVAKLKRLVNFKNADDSILEKVAQKIVVLRELISGGNFLDDAEKTLAKKIFEAYLDKLDFENFSDLATLSTLVYNEVLLKRVEKSINKCTNKDGDSYISDKLLKSHSDLTNQILSLKKSLGINKEVKEDEFTALQLLKKRFASWVNENKNECTMYVPFECSGCGKQDVKPVLLRKRVKEFDVLEHPFFSGRFLWNAEIMKDVENKIITKEQAARY